MIDLLIDFLAAICFVYGILIFYLSPDRAPAIQKLIGIYLVFMAVVLVVSR